MAEVDKPAKNGCAERLISTFLQEESDLVIIAAIITDMNRLSNIFLRHMHMHKRGNALLGYLTPTKF